MYDIDKIRADYPILQNKIWNKPLVYLDNAATTHKPREVISAISDFYSNNNSNIHRGIHALSENASTAYETSRETVKDFINAGDTAEVVFTHGTTDAINIVAASFGETQIAAGDEIIITGMEHHANIVPWQMLCKRKKAALNFLPVNDNGTLAVEQLEKTITKNTKLIAITYVSNVLGTVNPVKNIIALAHSKNIPVLVDGAQAVKHIPVDVRELDCDFFAFSGHKMYAGTGIGVLYGKKYWLDKMPPCRYGGGMVAHVDYDNTAFLDTPQKFEAGTSNISGAVGLDAAIKYINRIGLKNIAAHEKQLYDYAIKKLQTTDKVKIYGNAPEMCGAISFNLDNIHHADAGAILDKTGIAVRTGKHCAEPLMKHLNINGTIRASFAMYNTKTEIDLLTESINRVIKIMY